jgi:glycosyltransferase involved in cell wall biosynthesis
MSEAELLEFDDFLAGFSYARMVDAWRPHYLHSYFFYERSLWTLIAAYLHDLPRGVSCYADHMLDDFPLKLVPLQLRLADIVLATSARIKAELISLAPDVDPDKILVKPNAIDTRKFPAIERTDPGPGEPYRLVGVNRIEPKKGLLHLAEAMRILVQERNRKVELHLIGEADDHLPASIEYDRQLNRYLDEHELRGVVHLEGRKTQDEIRGFLDRSHVFVAPFVETETGDKDGIPTSLLEAMSTGITPLTTDAGSMLEVVDNGENGVVVAQNDGVALANAIESLIDDAELRRRLGAAAAAKARSHFDVQVCERRFHDRLRDVLAGNRRTQALEPMLAQN